MTLSEHSIKRPITVIVLFLVIAILGILGYFGLQAELMPKFTPPSMNVQVVYPGASPTEVENSLTRKLEDALSSLQGIESMRSFSFEGMSMVFVSFTYGTDIDKSISDAQNKIDSKKAELPSTILAPMINKVTVDDKSVMQLSITSSLETMAFSDFIDRNILPELLRIPGMAKVDAIGKHPREIQVNLDMEVIRALGIAPVQVLGSLRAANLDFPTGSLRSEKTHTILRLSGKLNSVEEIRNLVIMTLPTGTQIRLSDIAEVTESAKDADKLARINGKDAVLLNIFKQGDANAIDLSNRIEQVCTVLERDNAAIQLEIQTISDTSTFTRESIRSVFTDLLLAILLVTLVILVFLHNWRDALIVMLVVPLSIIGTFIGMRIFHFTLNMMSLLGLSVVIGVLVDDAIVVVENVYRHIEMGKKTRRGNRGCDAGNRIYRRHHHTGAGDRLPSDRVDELACFGHHASILRRHHIRHSVQSPGRADPGAAPHVPVRPAGRTACQKPLGAVDAMVRKNDPGLRRMGRPDPQVVAGTQEMGRLHCAGRDYFGLRPLPDWFHRIRIHAPRRPERILRPA